MIKNGLYSLHAKSRDGAAEDVGGVLILRDGELHGGDAYVFYTGSYECSAGSWKGKMTSQKHTDGTTDGGAGSAHRCRRQGRCHGAHRRAGYSI